MQDFPDMPPVWAAAMGALSWVLAWVVPIGRVDVPLWLPLALLIVGVALALWASLGFLTGKTPIEPRHTPRVLLVSGPYRLTRNPIYLAMLIILLAWTGYLGAPLGLLPVLAFPFIINRRFIQGEEDALRQVFGAEAEAFIARTPRWVFR